MNLFARVTSAFSKNTEKILLLEQFEGGFYVTHAFSNTHTRTVTLSDRYHIETLEALLRPSLRSSGYDRAIFAFNADKATTIEGVAHVVRDYPTEPINEGELDAMLFKAFWSFLNKYRPFAAKKFGTTELEPVVANIVVCGVSLGDHKVFNPLDFSGRDVTIRFRGTFVPRTILEPLEKISKFVKGNIIVIERGTILSEALNGENVFVDITDTAAEVYATLNNESSYLGRCEWGTRHITHSLAKFFGVNESIVSEVLTRYTKNQVSEKVRRVIERIAKEEANVLRGMLAPLLKEAGIGKMSLVKYAFRSRAMLPAALMDEMGFSKASFSEEWFGGDMKFEMKETVYDKASEWQHQSFVLLGYPYLHPQYAFLNQLLRRRARWLVPSAAIKN